MSFRVLNLTNGNRIKRSQAADRVEQCISVWVEEGFSIRDSITSERVAARSKQARLREPLALAELPGLVYRPMERDEAVNRKQWRRMREANRFVKDQVSAKESV
jgi:hypothetical protein